MIDTICSLQQAIKPLQGLRWEESEFTKHMSMRNDNFGIHIALVFLVALFQTDSTRAAIPISFSDGPAANFNDEDVKLMTANYEATLADANLHVLHEWANKSTKNSGTAQAVLAFAGPNGIACKRVRIANRSGSRASRSLFTFCDMEGKGWTMVSNDFAPVPKK